MLDEQDREQSGKFIAFLRWFLGIKTQAELSQRTGIPRSEISLYERGLQKPQAATFERMRAKLEVSPALVGFLRWCHRLIRKAPGMEPRRLEKVSKIEPWLPEERRSSVENIVERVLTLARAEHELLRSAPGTYQGSSPERVEALFEKLVGCSEAQQRFLIERSQAYRDPLLCLRLCRASEEAAASDPAKALALAELAASISRRVPGSGSFRKRLEGWCTGFIANACRVMGNDLTQAETTFTLAWSLWHSGEDPAGLLSEAYLIDLEASLRRDQRRFAQALELHENALSLAMPEQLGAILLNQAATLAVSGDPEGALQSLRRAAQAIDGVRQPRLRWVLRFNQAASLCTLGRAQEALPLLDEVRALADRLGNETDLIRTLWLEGNCAAGLGRREEALARLEQVRRHFEAKGNPFDYALASLDAALLYREAGRFAEIRALAEEMLAIFKAQQVHREALAAVILFQEAAEYEAVTDAMMRQLQDYLSKARANPKLRFGG